MGADDGGMTGKFSLQNCKPRACARPWSGRSHCVLRVEADDILRMASGASLRTASALADVAIWWVFVLPPAVLAVLAIGDQAGHSERGFAALKGCRADTNPAAWVCPSRPEWADRCTRCAER